MLSKEKIILFVWRRCIVSTGLQNFGLTILMLEMHHDQEGQVKLLKIKMKAMIDANHGITTLEIADRLNLSNSTVHDHVKRLGVISKFDI